MSTEYQEREGTHPTSLITSFGASVMIPPHEFYEPHERADGQPSALFAPLSFFRTILVEDELLCNAQF